MTRSRENTGLVDLCSRQLHARRCLKPMSAQMSKSTCPPVGLRVGAEPSMRAISSPIPLLHDVPLPAIESPSFRALRSGQPHIFTDVS